MEEPQQQPGNGAGEKDKEPKNADWRTMSLLDFMVEPEEEAGEEDWLIDGLLTAGGNTLFASDPKFGKTYISIFLALSVASGKPFLGRYKVLKTGPVCIHSPEGPRKLFKRRLKNCLDVMGLKLEDVPLIISYQRTLHLDNPADQDRIEKKLNEIQPVLQIFDPLKNCLGGSAAKDNSIIRMTDFLQDISERYGVTNFIVHHKNKSTNPNEAKEISGGKDLHAYADDIWLGKEFGERGRKISFRQRHCRPHKPICFFLPEDENGPMEIELVSEKGLQAGSSKEKKHLVVKIKEFVEENDTGWKRSTIRKEVKGSSRLQKNSFDWMIEEGILIERDDLIWDGPNPANPKSIPDWLGSKRDQKDKKSHPPDVLRSGKDGIKKGDEKTVVKEPVKSLIQKLFGGGKG